MLVMGMSSKKHKTPAIRFKGFTDAWEQRKLGEHVTIKSGWSPSNFVRTNSEGSELFIKVDDLNYSSREQNDSQMRVYDNPRFQKMKKGSTIFPKRGAAIMTNKVRILSSDAYMDTNMMALEPQEIDGDFLYTFIDRTGLYKIADTSTIPQINNKHIEPYIIYCPSVEEQTKVGSIFKKLDDTIALHQRQVNNYKLLKNSLIQQMFPQGGEQLPKMRFAGFSGEWVRKKLGEFVEINRGLTYKPEDVVSDGIRVLRSSNIKQDIFELRADDVFVRHDAANIPEIKNGDILVTSANGSTALVGKHAIVDKLPSKTVHGGFMLVIRCEHNYFINTWMSSSEYKRVLQLVQGGNGAIGNLSKKVLEEAVIAIPSDEEQTKIGNFFKKLDDNITFHQQKTDDYQQLKKVLLQQMFL